MLLVRVFAVGTGPQLLPHQPVHPAPLQREVDALHEVLDLLEGRVPELLVAEQLFFVRKQRGASLHRYATLTPVYRATLL